MVIITVIKELANEFDGEFNCLGENTIIYIIFSVPIGWKVRQIGNNREEITKTISNKKKFTERARFMASSLLNHVNNLPEEIHKIKSKYGHDGKKCQTDGVK